jgi:phosphatidylserine/phosphatidylglycerophosphate/cardiolipin synthase-like enzyme
MQTEIDAVPPLQRGVNAGLPAPSPVTRLAGANRAPTSPGVRLRTSSAGAGEVGFGRSWRRAQPTRRTALVRVLPLLLMSALIHLSAVRLWAFEASPSNPSWQVYFSPDGGCTQAVVNAIAAARQEIMVQAYEMTSPQIKRALVAAERRGVKVQAIFDPSAVRETNTMVGELSDGGIPVFIDSAHSPGLAHNKVMIIDRTVVITGSFNFTRAAESRNAENLLIIQDPALAAAYARNFANHLGHSSPLGTASIPTPRSYHHHYYYRHYRHSYW